MSTTGKIFTVLFSILLVGLIAFGIIWGVNNSNSIKEGLSGSNLYTEEDLKKAHEEGYNEALENEENYLATIDELRDNLTNVTDNLSRVNLELQKALEENKGYVKQVEDLEKLKTENEQTISTLEAEIKSNESVISGLETNKTELQSCISNLEEQITEHNNTILSLEDSISVLEAEKDNLIAELNTSEENRVELETEISELEEEISVLNSEKQSLISQNNLLSGQIESLNNQIDNLKKLNSQLESINTSNLSTIATLNSQIQSLNSQIADIMLASQNSSTIISNLNAEIDKLEESIAYYEEYISSLESNNKVIVTFEFDGSVYNVQAINKGSSASVVTPTSTDYVIFNFWAVDGEQIDLSTYTFSESTKVVADVTYKYDVKFMVESTEYNSQIVTSGTCATLPEEPIKQDYEFDGWSIDGVNIIENISTTPVTGNVTYKAVFTKLYTVTFMVENEVEDTQTIRNGEYATYVSIESTTYKVFNGWTLKGSIVDVSTQKIVSDTTFVASFTYKYDVKFMVDETLHNSQIVTSGACATLPTAPTKQGYEFDGWSIDGVDVVDNISTTPVTSNVIYKAVFTKLHTVHFMSENEVEDTQTIRNGGYATNVSIESTTYKVFNGWTLNGSIVDITTQKIVSDTTFVASFTYKYDVKFMVDETLHNSQVVTSGDFATLPNNPTKTGYTFKGWSLSQNGELVENINSISVTSNTTYYAIFEINNYVVTFNDGTSIVSTQNVSYNNNLILPDEPVKEGYTFKGWAENENGPVVDLERYKVTNNITFYAVYEINSYTVNFIVENENYDTQIVNYNNYATTPVAPTKTDYTFKGWSLTDGGELVENINSISVTSNTTYYAVFDYIYLFRNTNIKGLEISSDLSASFWSDGIDLYCVVSNGFAPVQNYILNQDTNTFEPIVFNGFNGLRTAEAIWTDGFDYYYSFYFPAVFGGSDIIENYVFDKETKTWNVV